MTIELLGNDANAIPKDLRSRIPPHVWDMLMKEAYQKAQTNVAKRTSVLQYGHYADKPIQFVEEVLEAKLSDDLQQVLLSIKDNPVTIARSANSIGKTFSAARAAVWFYKVHAGAQVHTTAAPPIDNLKKILWGEIGGLVDRYPSLFADDTVGTLHIQRNKQEFITAQAVPTTGTSEQREAKFSGRHAPYMLFIVDEGDAVPDEVYKGIESCMSGGVARLLIMFNPRSRVGSVWIKERDRRANVIALSALRHPNVITGQDIVPGAVNRDITVRRINEWTRPIVQGEKIQDEERFEMPDFLVGVTARADDGRYFQPLTKEDRKIVEPSFSYMVLGKYPPAGSSQLISTAWINAARQRWDAWVSLHGEQAVKGVVPIAGLDVAEFGSDFNVMMFRYNGFVPKPFLWSGIDTYDTAIKAAQYAKTFRPQVVNVDASGVGSSVAPAIVRIGKEEKLRAFPVKVAAKPMDFVKTELGEFFQLRDQLWWALREWLRTDPFAMLPPDEMLLEELSIPNYEYKQSKIKIMEKDQMRQIIKRSPDRAEALMLTFYPARKARVLSMNGVMRDEEDYRD